VEYALETVRRGRSAVGLKVQEGVVLAAEETRRPLQNPNVSDKVFVVDDHVAAVASGYIPDARVQVDHARWVAQTNRLIYDEPVEVETVAKRIADLCQQFTQFGGVRPFGVSMIIGGVDKNGPALYQTDPSGTYLNFEAVAIGEGAERVTEYLQQKFRPDMKLEEAMQLAVECIYLVSSEKTPFIKMVTIRTEDAKVTRVSDAVIEALAQKAREVVKERGK
jgi:proteasome alpha subunit